MNSFWIHYYRCFITWSHRAWPTASTCVVGSHFRTNQWLFRQWAFSDVQYDIKDTRKAWKDSEKVCTEPVTSQSRACHLTTKPPLQHRHSPFKMKEAAVLTGSSFSRPRLFLRFLPSIVIWKKQMSLMNWDCNSATKSNHHICLRKSRCWVWVPMIRGVLDNLMNGPENCRTCTVNYNFWIASNSKQIKKVRTEE